MFFFISSSSSFSFFLSSFSSSSSSLSIAPLILLVCLVIGASGRSLDCSRSKLRSYQVVSNPLVFRAGQQRSKHQSSTIIIEPQRARKVKIKRVARQARRVCTSRTGSCLPSLAGSPAAISKATKVVITITQSRRLFARRSSEQNERDVPATCWTSRTKQQSHSQFGAN